MKRPLRTPAFLDTTPFFGPSKGEQTKARIVASAINVIAEQGFGSFTFDAVGEPLDLKRAQVAYHFPDKKDLVGSCIRFIFALGAKTVELEMANEVVAPLGHLRAYIRGTIFWLTNDSRIAPTLTLSLYLATIDKGYAHVAQEVKRVGVSRVEKMVAGYFTDAKISPKEIEQISWAIHTLIVGEMIYLTSAHDKMVLNDMEEQIFQRSLRILRDERN